MIRIEVQQTPDADRVAWEFDGPWDADNAYSMIVGIDETITACNALGLPLYDVMCKAAPRSMVEFQESSRPKGLRCLTFQVNFTPAPSGASPSG